MWIFGKSYRDSVLDDKTKKDIDSINDQKKLMNIVVEAKNTDVANYAINRITDNNILYEIIMNKNILVDRQYEVLKRIEDKDLINKIVNSFPPTHRFIKLIYEKIDNPPYEISIQMEGEVADKNLLKDVSSIEDNDKLIKIVKKMNTTNASKSAIDKLYLKEDKLLKELYNQVFNPIVNEYIVEKLNWKTDKEFLMNILENGSINKNIIKIIAKKLDSKDPLLEKEVCPNCGAIDSIKEFSEYRRSIDLDVAGYHCSKCNYESLEQTGLGKIKKVTIKLKDYIK